MVEIARDLGVLAAQRAQSAYLRAEMVFELLLGSINRCHEVSSVCISDLDARAWIALRFRNAWLG
jgi:hypothetical protein